MREGGGHRKSNIGRAMSTEGTGRKEQTHHKTDRRSGRSKPPNGWEPPEGSKRRETRCGASVRVRGQPGANPNGAINDERQPRDALLRNVASRTGRLSDDSPRGRCMRGRGSRPRAAHGRQHTSHWPLRGS
eukprot:6204989-Pleurochrysis_carterae.AAC.4